MKTKLMLLIFTLSFMVMAACAKEPNGDDEGNLTPWDGTEIEKPGDGNTITEAKHLAWLANSVNGTLPADDPDYKVEGNTHANDTFTLGKDIDLGSKEWPMIGTMAGRFAAVGVSSGPNYKNEKPFRGTFDGDNKSIKNLKIDKSKGKDVDGNPVIGVGLFGRIGEGATIKNLRVHSGDVKGPGFVGGIVGKGVGSKTSDEGRITLTGLSVGPDLIVASVNDTGIGVHGNDLPVGGIAGSVLNGNLKFSYNDGAKVTGTSWVGGVIACLHSGELMHSFNAGAVVGTSIVGGVTAHSIKEGGSSYEAKTDNVYNSGSVEGNGGDVVGGVLGQHELGTLGSSFNTGVVSGNSTSQGQIVGYALVGAVGGDVTVMNNNQYVLADAGKAVGARAVLGSVAGTLKIEGATGDTGATGTGGGGTPNTALEGIVIVDALNTGAGDAKVDGNGNKLWLLRDGKDVVLNADYVPKK